MTRMGHLQMADFASEWWPPSNRCGGRLRVGISGRLRRNTHIADARQKSNRNGCFLSFYRSRERRCHHCIVHDRASPIQALDQHRQLRTRQPDSAIVGTGPDEFLALETFCIKA